MTRVLVVTNDFPPRPGGIQAFVQGLVDRLPRDEVTVYASSHPGDREYDARQPYRVVRDRARMLLPTPGVRRRLVDLVHRDGIEAVWFGAAAPLGLLAPALRAAGARRLVATTHGHEVGWAALPGARSVLRRIAGSVDALTYLGDYTRERLAAALGDVPLERLVPGVDVERFRPDPAARAQVRAELGLADRPVVLCVSRLVPRKGQDVLVDALPAIRAQVPDAALLLVGGGPDEPRLRRRIAAAGLGAHVVVTGARAWSELPSYYAAGDVFAMPCRTRRGGLDVEGLGIVYLEASATALPVVAGSSGGAPDAVLPGTTGRVVDGRSAGEVAAAVTGYLTDSEAAARAGRAGRDWVSAQWSWEQSARRLRELLEAPAP